MFEARIQKYISVETTTLYCSSFSGTCMILCKYASKDMYP